MQIRRSVKSAVRHLGSPHMIKYLFAGGTAFATEYMAFFLLFNVAHVHVYAANSLSFAYGLAVSFTLNRTWAFKRQEFRLAGHHQLMLYLGLALFNLVFVNVIVGVLQVAGLTPLLGKIIAMCVIVAWNFFAFRLFIFAGKSGS